LSMFLRKPLLNKKDEEELKQKISFLWKKGYTGKEIAKILKFGEGKYEKLNVTHVYHYRKKFNLPKRWDHYRMGKQEDIMLVNRFRQLLKKNPLRRQFFEKRRRAFLILLFWTGLRKSEIYERKREDFVITENELIIKAERKKKAKDETGRGPVIPIELPMSWWGVREAAEWISRFKNKWDMPFNIKPVTAWKYAKILDPKLYPHYFRLNRVTQFSDDPDTTIAELRAWFGFHPATIESYLGTDERLRKRMRKRLSKKMGDEK